MSLNMAPGSSKDCCTCARTRATTRQFTGPSLKISSTCNTSSAANLTARSARRTSTRRSTLRPKPTMSTTPQSPSWISALESEGCSDQRASHTAYNAIHELQCDLTSFVRRDPYPGINLVTGHHRSFDQVEENIMSFL